MIWLGAINLLVAAAWLYRLSLSYPGYSLRHKTISYLATQQKTKTEFAVFFVVFSTMQLLFAIQVTSSFYAYSHNLPNILFMTGAIMLAASSFFHPETEQKHSYLVTASVLLVLTGAVVLAINVLGKMPVVGFLLIATSIILPAGALVTKSHQRSNWELWLIVSVVAWNILGILAVILS